MKYLHMISVCTLVSLMLASNTSTGLAETEPTQESLSPPILVEIEEPEVIPIYIPVATSTEAAPIPEPVQTFVDLGRFKITAYCSCSKCCGKNAKGITRTGTRVTAGRTISVDPKIIPLGSTVYIEGVPYVAEDTGSGIKGHRIDMYFNTHQEALNFGVQRKNVQLLVN